ncbi:MAG: hypothetical protein ACOY5Y_06980 [Pseudomonadota bacterium]
MAVTAPPTVDVLPTAPDRLNDTREEFVANVGAWYAAWSTYRSQMVALGSNVYGNAQDAFTSASSATASAAAAAASASAAMAATGLMRRSADTLSVGAGAKNLTGLNVPSAGSFADGDEVTLIDAGDAEVRMWGVASSANMAAGTMTVTVASGDFAGSGSSDSWIVIHRAFEGLLSATAAEIWAAATRVKGASPEALAESSEIQTLTDAATVAWDTAVQGYNAKVTLGGNRTIGAPTNLKDGVVYSLTLNPATYTPAWNAIWYFGAAEAPVLPASVWSKISAQYDAARNSLDVVGVLVGA